MNLKRCMNCRIEAPVTRLFDKSSILLKAEDFFRVVFIVSDLVLASTWSFYQSSFFSIQIVFYS